MTLTNDSTGSAVLGSATITPTPNGVTINPSPAPSIVAKPSGKTWFASLKSNTIKLRALNEASKLAPGQFVTVDFFVTVSATDSYVFNVGAKPTLDYSGSSFFTELGGNPTIDVCDSTQSTPCGASSGDVSNPPPNVEVGSFMLDSPCTACTVSISNTPGDFCNTLGPPGKCKAPVVPQFDITGYTGDVHFTLACDKSNCPVIVGPSPSPTAFAVTNSAGADTYPVYFTDSDGPSTTGQLVQILSSCTDTNNIAPCVLNQYRISSEGGSPGDGDLQTVIKFTFGGGGDPRPAH